MNLAFEISLFIFEVLFLQGVKYYDMGPTALLPLRRIFITINNLLHSAGFEPANLGCSGKHDKHYTTEATIYYIVVMDE
jgi:hypothetical protein